MSLPDYLERARRNEEIFRNVLRNFEVQQSLNPSLSLKEIFNIFSTGNRTGKWTIVDFRVGPYQENDISLKENEALLSLEELDENSGFYRIEKYQIKENKKVEFAGILSYGIK